MSITAAVQTGEGRVCVYNERGSITRTLSGELMGFTSATVCIRRDRTVYTYNEKGQSIHSAPVNTSVPLSKPAPRPVVQSTSVASQERSPRSGPSTVGGAVAQQGMQILTGVDNISPQMFGVVMVCFVIFVGACWINNLYHHDTPQSIQKVEAATETIKEEVPKALLENGVLYHTGTSLDFTNTSNGRLESSYIIAGGYFKCLDFIKADDGNYYYKIMCWASDQTRMVGYIRSHTIEQLCSNIEAYQGKAY